MAQSISVSLQDRVLTVTLDRAVKRNALTHEMYTGLAEALERADADPDVRVVVLRAEGGLFTAGNDLADFADLAGDDRPDPGGRHRVHPALAGVVGARPDQLDRLAELLGDLGGLLDRVAEEATAALPSATGAMANPLPAFAALPTEKA